MGMGRVAALDLDYRRIQGIHGGGGGLEGCQKGVLLPPPDLLGQIPLITDPDPYRG